MREHPSTNPVGVNIGWRLSELRKAHGYSIRALAEKSRLSVNTLSLIENGRSSPSVSTLQQIAMALEVPMTAFFETKQLRTNIIFQKAGERLQGNFTHGTLEDMGSGMDRKNFEPFLVTLEPGTGSGDSLMAHSGVEFVFCLEGHVLYTIESQSFLLEPGDSLFFEAYLPHRWQNPGPNLARSLLILCPADKNVQPTEVHFTATD